MTKLVGELSVSPTVPHLRRVLSIRDLFYCGVVAVTPSALATVFGLADIQSRGQVVTSCSFAWPRAASAAATFTGMTGVRGRRLPPIIMGHEAPGTVEETGKAVTRFRRGDRVTFDSTVSCGKCFFCSRGQINLCDQCEIIGVSTAAFRRMGAFAEFVTVPERIAYHLPATMPFEHATLTEAVSVAVHAVSLQPPLG